MANEEHVAKLREGTKTWNQWREKNPSVMPDLTKADLTKADLLKADLTGARLTGADFTGARLTGADFTGARLTGAKLRHTECQDANFTGADLNEADLFDAYLQRANLTEAELCETDFTKANLTDARLVKASLTDASLAEANLNRADLAGAFIEGASLADADLADANLTKAYLAGANLTGADLACANLTKANLIFADLIGADLGGANLVEARLANANLTMANLAEANLTGAEFGKAKGLREALLAETCRAEPGGPSQFETVERRGLDRHWDWERVRVFGRLPLFGVSYAALILVPVMMYLLAFYNARVADLNELGVKTTAALQNYPATTPKENAQRDALLAVADFLQGAERQAIPSQSFLLLVSTVLLAIASTVYTIACPSRVKEFSRDQWCDQLKQPLIHYWPMCWRSAPLRVVCLVCYTLGGLGALWVLAVKVFRAGRYILEHSEFGLW